MQYLLLATVEVVEEAGMVVAVEELEAEGVVVEEL